MSKALEAAALAAVLVYVDDYGSIQRADGSDFASWAEIKPSAQEAILEKFQYIVAAALRAYAENITDEMAEAGKAADGRGNFSYERTGAGCEMSTRTIKAAILKGLEP